jgi:RNase P protein component
MSMKITVTVPIDDLRRTLDRAAARIVKRAIRKAIREQRKRLAPEFAACVAAYNLDPRR